MEVCNPFVIGICGKSCCGKSSIARKICEGYKDVLHIDSDKFFRREADNWQVPESLRIDKLIECIKKLKSGKHCFMPSVMKTEVFDKKVVPHKLIVIEGHLLFVDERLVKLFDRKIFVEVSEKNMLFRRLRRAGSHKRKDYIKNVVIPEARKFEDLQRKNADIIIDGNKSEKKVFKEFKENVFSQE